RFDSQALSAFLELALVSAAGTGSRSGSAGRRPLTRPRCLFLPTNAFRQLTDGGDHLCRIPGVLPPGDPTCICLLPSLSSASCSSASSFFFRLQHDKEIRAAVIIR